MKRPCLLLPLALALATGAGLAHADGLMAEVVATDGTRVSGTLGIDVIRLETAGVPADIRLADVAEIVFEKGQASVKRLDGSTSKGKCLTADWPLKSSMGDLKLGLDSLASIRFSAAVPAASSVLEGAVESYAPMDVDARGIALTADGSSLAVARVDDPSLEFVSCDSFGAPLSLKLDDPPQGIFPLLDAGKVAVLQKSELLLVDASRNAIDKRLAMPGWVGGDICALPGGLIFIAYSQMTLMSLADGKTVFKSRTGAPCWLAPVPDGSRIYAGGSALWLLHEPGKPPTDFYLPANSSGASNSSSIAFMRITPDGKFGIASSGAVLRLSRSPMGDLSLVKQLEPNVGAVILPKERRVILMTTDGWAREYDFPGFKLLGSLKLIKPGWHAAWCESRRTIYYFGALPKNKDFKGLSSEDRCPVLHGGAAALKLK